MKLPFGLLVSIAAAVTASRATRSSSLRSLYTLYDGVQDEDPNKQVTLAQPEARLSQFHSHLTLFKEADSSTEVLLAEFDLDEGPEKLGTLFAPRLRWYGVHGARHDVALLARFVSWRFAAARRGAGRVAS